MLDARKRGDQAFREKDFKTAIDCYSQVLLIKILFVILDSVRTHMVYIMVLKIGIGGRAASNSILFLKSNLYVSSRFKLKSCIQIDC